MELRQLEYLVAVVEDGNFTRAAERMHVTQPGVSTQIRRLEREFGHDLLDRSDRTVRPTAVGAAVLPHARSALRAVADARRAADELSGLVRGTLALATEGLPLSVDIPGTLAGFRARYPGVDLVLSVVSSDELLAGLRSGRLDVGFAGIGDAPPEGLSGHVLSDRAVAVVTGPDDPLAGRDAVTLAELADRDIACLPPGTRMREATDEAFARRGLRPRVTFEASHPDVLVRMAAFGLGVALVPRPIADAAGPEVRVVELAEPDLRTRFGLLWRGEGPTSPATGALVAHVRAGSPAR